LVGARGFQPPTARSRSSRWGFEPVSGIHFAEGHAVRDVTSDDQPRSILDVLQMANAQNAVGASRARASSARSRSSKPTSGWSRGCVAAVTRRPSVPRRAPGRPRKSAGASRRSRRGLRRADAVAARSVGDEDGAGVRRADAGTRRPHGGDPRDRRHDQRVSDCRLGDDVRRAPQSPGPSACSARLITRPGATRSASGWSCRPGRSCCSSRSRSARRSAAGTARTGRSEMRAGRSHRCRRSRAG